jgi:hypothetical protein
MKNVRKPAPMSPATVVESSGSSSIASGRTSKSATATTIPPLSAITVGSEWAMRSANAPPATVVSTANAVRGIAISWSSTRRPLFEHPAQAPAQRRHSAWIIWSIR